MIFKVECINCGGKFDFFKAEWCGKHKNGRHSKMCPKCGSCSCDSKASWKNLYKIKKDLEKYGSKKGFNVKRYLIDSTSATLLWVSLWLVVYSYIGVDRDKIMALLVSVVLLNFALGGLQGKWMDTFRKWFDGS